MFKEKLIHLDLKGAPPTVDYLVSMFPFMQKCGATGLCIEWEDMLPFTGKLASIRARYAYSKADIARILKEAKKAGLSVMPLMQTFGHLEFLLKHRQFSGMCEVKENLHDLCPMHPKALPVILDLVDQTLALHPGIRWIHLGGDEVWTLGTCRKCAPFVKKSGKEALYLKHIMPVIKHVRSRGVRVLIWDDMLREWSPGALREIGKVAEPVVWRYGADIETGLPEGVWGRFGRNLPHVWAASAFKGADGPDIIWPDTGIRVNNHERWVEQSRKTRFEGMILTGWSRYNHCMTLCETMPAGTPALALCLAILGNGGYSDQLRKKVFMSLGLGDIPLRLTPAPKGRFPGAEVFSLTGKLQGARQLLVHVRNMKNCYFPRFNGGRVATSQLKVIVRDGLRAGKIAGEVKREIVKPLGKVMFPSDVREFIAAKVDPVIGESRRIAKDAAVFLNQRR